MATASVAVASALSGNALLSEKVLDCQGLVPRLLSELGHRPSRPVTLLLDGERVEENFLATHGASLRFTAVMGDAVSADERGALVRRFQEELRIPEVLDLFRALPAEARDDATIVLAAVRNCNSCFQYASEACRNDRAIVFEAARGVNNNHLFQILRFAGEDIRKDRAFLIELVRHTPELLEVFGDVVGNDKDLVLAAVRRDAWLLRYAGEACRNDRDVVLAAVRRNAQSLRFAGEACRNDKAIVLEALGQTGLCQPFVGDECRCDPDVMRALNRKRHLRANAK